MAFVINKGMEKRGGDLLQFWICGATRGTKVVAVWRLGVWGVEWRRDMKMVNCTQSNSIFGRYTIHLLGSMAECA